MVKNADDQPGEITARRQNGRFLFRFSRPRSRAWIVAGIYAVFATLWILYSDRCLKALAPDAEVLAQWGTYKGLGFVAVTTILLLLMMRRAFGALEEANRSLKANDLEIQRLNRLYDALSQVNQAIVWTPDRGQLLRNICRVLIEHGRFKIAWIVWHDPVSGSTFREAELDKDDPHLRALLTSPEEPAAWAANLDGDRPRIRNDLRTDQASSLWRGAARRHDVRAAASFPIKTRGKLCGVLSVGASEPVFFHDKEIALLEEAATDVSFALDNLALAQARREAQTEAEHEKHFSDTLIDSMPGIVYVYDSSSRFLRWNKNFETVTGYNAEQIKQMAPLDFFDETEKPLVRERIAEVFAQGQSFVEAPFRTRDGRSLPYFFTGRIVSFDGRDCVVGVGIDVSERLAAEKALHELNENLERMVAGRTAELQSALVRAEAADKVKSAFLATMSHELRTPLNSILGFTGILLKGMAGDLNAEQMKQLGMVQGSARHLLALINDVLDLSKIEAGQLEIHAQSFDLNASIEQAIEAIRPQAEAKGLKLSVQLSPRLGRMTSDRRRVDQILLNLLNNAVKFTDRGSVGVTTEWLPAYQRDPGATPQPAAQISVVDTGIGVPAEELPDLFQPFHQLDRGLARQHEGTGLGLAICRRLASLLGGQIQASSDQPNGSTFTVILPLQLPPKPHEPDDSPD